MREGGKGDENKNKFGANLYFKRHRDDTDKNTHLLDDVAVRAALIHIHCTHIHTRLLVPLPQFFNMHLQLPHALLRGQISVPHEASITTNDGAEAAKGLEGLAMKMCSDLCGFVLMVVGTKEEKVSTLIIQYNIISNVFFLYHISGPKGPVKLPY